MVNLDLANGLDQSQCHEHFHEPAESTAGWDAMLDATFAFIETHVPDARSLCDIGCGNGRLLYLAKQAGWKTLGLEMTDDAATKAANAVGTEVIAADFLEFDPPPEHIESYDVVCLRHVIEHLPDSRLAMRKIRKLLKPGGYALLEFPNIEAPDKRVKRWLANAGWHRRKFRPNFMPGHCNELVLQPRPDRQQGAYADPKNSKWLSRLASELKPAIRQ
ncbi:MAG: class I SAM-dependent methyltransferase [Gammaproteobacteria bacterium]|nr:class I SAM-dependent methyltransferase [Gammaproteobacteria bacterium]